MNDLGRIGHGLYLEDLEPGTRWHTAPRTIFEADLASFVNLTWFTEELFTVLDHGAGQAISGRPVPAFMVMCFSEGLLKASLEHGLAFLQTEMDVKAPTHVGDTIRVRGEVLEARPTSRGDRGLVKTSYCVVNQRDEIVLVYRALRLMKRRAPTVP